MSRFSRHRSARATANLGPKAALLATVRAEGESQAAVDDDAPTLDKRYAAHGELLGEGGMGRVWAVEDRRIGRPVALKVLRGEIARSARQRNLFMREARVQGQLEHPAVVPVYDIGEDESGAPYFTMKRVRGTTLAKILDDLRTNEATRSSLSQRRLLTAFGSVCLAIDFAHERGVVHRDLKPSNLMIGDYGEVHVLDWGIARVLCDESEPGEDLKLPERPVLAAVSYDETDVAGTHGYMAPEQHLGAAVGPAADIYALGAILFEILTLKPLFKVSLGMVDPPSPTEIPPELHALCTRATATNPASRFASARELYDALEKYLDGERSEALRRKMVEAHLTEARELLEKEGPVTSVRKTALQAIGRALALQPDDPDALHTLYRLFAEPPKRIPPEVAAELDAHRQAQLRVTTRTAAVGMACVALFVPLMLWIGVRNPLLFAAFVGLSSATAIFCWRSSLRTHISAARTLVILGLATTAFAISSAMYGPLVLVPSMIATNTMGFALHLSARGRFWASVIGTLGVLLPMALSALGVMDSPYISVDGGLLLRPLMLELPPGLTLLCIAAASIVTIWRSAVSAGHVRETLTSAEERLYLHRWHLRQLLPGVRPHDQRAMLP